MFRIPSFVLPPGVRSRRCPLACRTSLYHFETIRESAALRGFLRLHFRPVDLRLHPNERNSATLSQQQQEILQSPELRPCDRTASFAETPGTEAIDSGVGIHASGHIDLSGWPRLLGRCRHRQSFSTLRPATLQDCATCFRLHSSPKAMHPPATNPTRLIGALHDQRLLIDASPSSTRPVGAAG